jgi:hypothetical protein
MVAGAVTIDMSVGALPSILDGIGSLTVGAGNVGNVTVVAGKLSILNNGLIGAGAFGVGNPGSVSVSVAGQLSMTARTRFSLPGSSLTPASLSSTEIRYE